jgi:uncharacterized repeat protein (TIGR01451 family)
MKSLNAIFQPGHAIGTAIRLIVAALVLAIGMVDSWVVDEAEAAPAAGTIIGNQASATYTDGNNVQRTATSNVVQTTVAQKAALTLTPASSLPGLSPGQVVFAHTLTNTGNGSDTFNLATALPGGFSLAPVTFYADTNGDGVADNNTAITSTGPLAAGAIFRFVAVMTVPAAQANGATGNINVKGTSVFDNTVSNSATDTVTVNSNTSISVIKSMSAISGIAGSGPYTVTLTYTNNGVATANAVTLADVIPAGMTYVAASGRWSVTGATVLTDASNADVQGTAPNTIIYDFNVTVANRVTAVINQVPAGVSGTLTFQVNIGGTATGTLNNTATYQYNLGGPTIGPLNTNTVGFTVVPPTITAAVVADDNPLQAGDTTLDKVVTVPSAVQGATATFNNRIHNNGNTTDTFDITLSGSTFPTGTSFLLFQSDGVTPLVNTAGSGAPDTGPVAVGATYTVIVKALLPPNASGGGPYNATVTATSVNIPTVNDTVTDRLTTIAATTVDITNNAALPGGSGAGAGPEASAVVTNSVAPNATSTTFTLFINNIGGSSDTFDLTAWADSGATTLLPAGWTVTFKNSGGATITNTGVIAAGANIQVNAVVSIPAGSSGTKDIYFRALSPTTGASDRKHDAVTISGGRSLTIVPNNTGQVFPNGTVVYSHTITNSGTVLEGNNASGAGSTTLTLSNNQAGWTTTLYWDNDGDGKFDGTEPVVSDLTFLSGGAAGLSPGESAVLFVKVVAPSGAATGAVNVTTLTATTDPGAVGGIAGPPPATATDTTTVNGSQVQLLKEQALDTNCTGTGPFAYGSAAISNASPGACVRYRITATNVGTTNVTAVTISDATPPNTVYDDGSRKSTGGACGTGAVNSAASSTVGPPAPPAPPAGPAPAAPACNGTGSISVTLPGALPPTQQLILYFSVMINP